jgi:hypothetical protein
LLYFVRLNIISAFYGLIFYFIAKLLLNYIANSESSIFIVFIFGIIFCFLLNMYLTNIWMDYRKITYLTSILWLPYWILFSYVFAFFFPKEFTTDTENYAVGIIIMKILIFYPIIILISSSMAISLEKRKLKYLNQKKK